MKEFLGVGTGFCGHQIVLLPPVLVPSLGVQSVAVVPGVQRAVGHHRLGEGACKHTLRASGQGRGNVDQGLRHTGCCRLEGCPVSLRPVPTCAVTEEHGEDRRPAEYASLAPAIGI